MRRHISICYLGCEACPLEAPSILVFTNSCAQDLGPDPNLSLKPETINLDPHHRRNPTPNTHSDTPDTREYQTPPLTGSGALAVPAIPESNTSEFTLTLTQALISIAPSITTALASTSSSSSDSELVSSAAPYARIQVS